MKINNYAITALVLFSSSVMASMTPVQDMDLMLTIPESLVLTYMIIIQLAMASLVTTLSKLTIYTPCTVTWT